MWFWNDLNRAWFTHIWWSIHAEMQIWRVGLEGIICLKQARIDQVSLSAVTVGKLTDCIGQEQMKMQLMSYLHQVPLWLHGLNTQHLRHQYHSTVILDAFLSFPFCKSVTHFLCLEDMEQTKEEMCPWWYLSQNLILTEKNKVLMNYLFLVRTSLKIIEYE